MTDHAEEPEQKDVLDVGAGPTGLTAAVRPAQLGIPHVVLDAAPAPTTTSKAALVHASSLELLAELGVADDLVPAGPVMHRIVMVGQGRPRSVVVDRGRPLVRVDLTGLPSSYPFALGVPQSTTEALLLRRLHELGGSVRRSHRVGSVTTTDAGDPVVAGVAESLEGRTFEIGARYV